MFGSLFGSATAAAAANAVTTTTTATPQNGPWIQSAANPYQNTLGNYAKSNPYIRIGTTQFIPPAPISVEFMVDLIFVAVEKNLRQVIREELLKIKSDER